MAMRRRLLQKLIARFRSDGLYREAARLARHGRKDDARKLLRRADLLRFGCHLNRKEIIPEEIP